MAQVTNFKDRIADYAGALAETDDDALKQYTIDCCQEVIKLLGSKNSDDLFKFTLKSGFISIDMSSTDKDIRDESGFPKQADKILVPKNIGLTCTLNVVHETSLGWDVNTGEWRGQTRDGFPYGFGVLRGTMGSAGARGKDPAAGVSKATSDPRPDAREAAHKQRKTGKTGT